MLTEQARFERINSLKNAQIDRYTDENMRGRSKRKENSQRLWTNQQTKIKERKMSKKRELMPSEYRLIKRRK